MTIRLPSVLMVAALAALATQALAQSSLPKKSLSAPTGGPMVFFLAKGRPDACGPGCSEWIAADGPIDGQAVHRLRALLLRLGDKRAPVFFHSTGGSQAQSLAMGRLLRARGMTTGVSRTVPMDCASLNERACRQLMQSGRVLDAELRSIATCASACVYALIGGAVRQVPPGARLAVHASRLVQLHPDGSTVTLRAHASPRNEDLHGAINAQLRAYIREMGIDARLMAAILKTPNEQAYRLSRDEIVSFGIDAREFQETPWMTVDIADKEFYVGKFLARSAEPQRKTIRTSAIQLSCAAPGGVRMTYARGLTTGDLGKALDLTISIGGQSFDLSQSGAVRGMGWFETGEMFDSSAQDLPYESFEAASKAGSVELVEGGAAAASAPRVVKLSTQGLSEAMAWLRGRCAVPH